MHSASSKQHGVQLTMAPSLVGLNKTNFFFLFCYIKDNTNFSNQCNLDELKTNISIIIADISAMALQTVSTNMLRSVNAGAHFQQDVRVL
jgi:hypothetical protein